MKHKNLLLLFWLIVYPHHTYTLLDTLKSMSTYALTLPEYPEPSNNDLLHPDYNQIFLHLTPSFLSHVIHRIRSFFGIDSTLPFNIIDESIALMRLTTKERIELGYKKNTIIKLPNTTAHTCIIWGDVQGAYHSLVRDLTYLEQQGYIDQVLRITQPNTYLIFNGDAINRSPYCLETLAIIMNLMRQNPHNVFYIQGNHETVAVWQDHNLAYELSGSEYKEAEIPYFDDVVAFFDTLPIAVYIPSQNTDHSPTFIRISHYNRAQMHILDESHLSSFLLSKSETTQLFNLKNRSDTQQFIDIRAIIEGQSRSSTHQQLDGLKLMESDQGATAWTQLSAPTYVYQKIYDFHFDAFTIVQTHEYIDHATIELHNQDVHTLDGFKKNAYNLLTGAPYNGTSAPLLTRINAHNTTPDKGNEIVIGSISDFDNSSAATGKLLREGMSLKCNQMNIERNGINGKRLRLVMLNDHYTPYRTVQQANRLLNDYKTNIILSPQGTPTLEACLPLIKQNKLLALFNWGGANIFRTPELIGCINYRTSYYNEARALIEYALNTLYLKHFTFFFQDDSFGHSLLEGVHATLKKHGITQWSEVPYKRNAIKLESSTVKKVEDSHPEALFFFSTTTPAENLVTALGTPYLINKYLFGITFLSDVFKNFLTLRGLNLIISRVVPNPKTAAITIAQEYRKHVQEYTPGLPISIEGFEAYLNTSLLIEVMQNMTGEITKDKIIKSFESMKNYEFKGLNLTFDPKTRELVTDIITWIDTGKEWIPAHKK